MHLFIVLDRTGSMAPRWVETVSALNAFVEQIDDPDLVVTLGAFDSTSHDLLRDAVPRADYKPLAVDEVSPRALTPLYDAIGKMVVRAEADKSERKSILILSDGQENSSHEFTQAACKAAVERFKGAGYLVTFIGMDIDAQHQAASVGVGYGQTVNTSTGSVRNSTRAMAVAASAYASSGRAATADVDSLGLRKAAEHGARIQSAPKPQKAATFKQW